MATLIFPTTEPNEFGSRVRAFTGAKAALKDDFLKRQLKRVKAHGHSKSASSQSARHQAGEEHRTGT
jgi:hypothetical protein